MLQKISDRIQGWVAGIIIVIIAVVFVFWGIEYYLERDHSTSQTIATVNGQKISQKQIDLLYRQLLARFQATQSRPLLSQEQKQLQALTLEQLISRTALTQAAIRSGFSVSQTQVQQLVMQAPEFQVNGVFSPQRFQQFLLVIQMTEQQFIEDIQSNFLLNQVAVGLESSAFVLPDELKQVYQFIYQTRDFGYFTLPLSKYLTGISVSEKEIQTYYQQNKNAYKTPEKMQVSYVLLSPADIEKNMTVSQAEIKAYYDKLTPSSSTPLKSLDAMKNDLEKRLKHQQAQQMLSQQSEQLSDLTYTNPNTLSVAAKKLGLTIQTSPWFTREGLKNGLFSNPAVVNAAFSDDVLQNNNNSNLISLSDGSVLVLRVNNYQTSTVQPLSEVKSIIQTVLEKNKAEAKVGLIAYQVSSSLGQGTPPQTLASRYGIVWVSKTSVKRDNKEIPAPILASVFMTPPLKTGEASGVNSLVLANGDYIVLQVKSSQLADFSKALVKELDQLQNQVAETLGNLDYHLYSESVMNRSKVKLTQPR